LSVPGGGGGERRSDWDLAVAGVRHAATRGLTLRAAVHAIAAQSGMSERTLWRWLARSEAATPKTPWHPSEEDLVVYARWCANASAAWRERRHDGAAVPSLRTFQEGIAAALTPGQRAGLRAGENARREFDAYLRWEPEGRNDLWEADHKQLDIEVRAQGFDRPVRPWLTLFVEAYSRVVPGWALSVRPHSGSILAAFGSAVALTPTKPWGGVPVRLRVDRGADFLCGALREACGRLGVVLDPAPAYSPFRKGKVEAAGKSIDRALLPPLPGYLAAGRETRQARAELISLAELIELCRAGIESWNRSHAHPVLGCTLGEAWQRDATPIRTVPDERLRWMMLAEDHRVVQKEGVRLGGCYFTAPELTGRRGSAVHVLHWPHDRRRVEVVLGSEWLCSAYPQGALSADQRAEVLAERRRQKLEADRLRRKAARRARYGLSPATATGDAEPTTVLTHGDVADATMKAEPRSVSLLGLETD
jgi:putative transposase